LRAVLGGVDTGLGAPSLAHNLALGGTTVTITPAAGFVIEAVLGFFLVTVVLSTAGCRPRWQSRAASDRYDSHPQHHHGGPLQAPLSTQPAPA
jgi:hypothetical protein